MKREKNAVLITTLAKHFLMKFESRWEGSHTRLADFIEPKVIKFDTPSINAYLLSAVLNRKER